MTTPSSAYAIGLMASNRQAAFDAIAKRRCETSFLDFVQLFWPVLDPGQPFVRGWVQEIIARHLEAIHRGEILKLLANVPPGFTKSRLVSCMFAAWEWGPQRRPDLRYVAWSYDRTLTERDNADCRKVIMSPLYQRLWGQCPVCRKRPEGAARCATCELEKRFRLLGDQNAKRHYANDFGGFRFASSTGGAGTGWRADRLIVDDPHSVQSAESDAERQAAVDWFAATLPSRIRVAEGQTREPLPDWVAAAHRQELGIEEADETALTATATIVIMQRVHLKDIAGVILANPALGYEHVMIEMEYLGDSHPGRIPDEETGVAPSSGLSKIGYRDPRRARMASVPLDLEVPEGTGWRERIELRWWCDFANLWSHIGLDMATLADPVRYPRAEVDRQKAQMRLRSGDDAVEAQFQQWPQEAGGTMFPESCVQYIHAGDVQPPVCGFETRGWDLAAGESAGAAATVGVRLHIDFDNRVIISDCAKVRGGPAKVDALIVGTAANDGREVVYDIPTDPAAGGIYMINSFTRLLQGMVVETSTEGRGGKVGRAGPLSSQWKARNVYLVIGKWNAEFVRIVKQFPVGTYKDEVDAATRAYDNQVRAAPISGGMSAPPLTVKVATNP